MIDNAIAIGIFRSFQGSFICMIFFYWLFFWQRSVLMRNKWRPSSVMKNWAEGAQAIFKGCDFFSLLQPFQVLALHCSL